MRWLLAGLAFALLVALAVVTVAAKAEVTSLRRELHEIELAREYWAAACRAEWIRLREQAAVERLEHWWAEWQQRAVGR